MRYPIALLGALLLVASCADDATPDAQPTTTTAPPTTTSTSTSTEPPPEVLDVLADTDAWAAGWFDGAPILDGPWISSRTSGSVTIGGCVLGSEYPMTVSVDGVIVDETRPLVEYDCSEPRMDPEVRAQLLEFVFDDPDRVTLSDHRLELADDEHVLVFSPVRDIAALEGDWEITSIDGVDAANALALHFRPAADGLSVGIVELRLCEQVLATATYSHASVGGFGQGGFDAFCTDPPHVDNGEVETLQRAFTRTEPADLRWIAADEFEVFDGATVYRATPITG